MNNFFSLKLKKHINFLIFYSQFKNTNNYKKFHYLLYHAIFLNPIPIPQNLKKNLFYIYMVDFSPHTLLNSDPILTICTSNYQCSHQRNLH